MKASNEIRLNWNWALEYTGIDNFNDISQAIEWGFTLQDLFVLCCLHEAGKHREKIEELLTDCNFHTECGLLHDGKYDECRKVISENLDDELIPFI